MNFGLQNKSAIICASTSGLGLACAQALAQEGAAVTICGRDPSRLEAALRTSNGTLRGVSADLRTAEGRRAVLAACPDPDILVTNISGPPPRSFFEAKESEWENALVALLTSPLDLIRSVVPGMRARRFGRIVNITSAMVQTPRPHHVLSTSARTALTAAMKALSLEVARDGVTINNLLPERIDTPRQDEMARAAMVRDGITYDEARAAQVQSIAARRLGRPEEFGAACAFLCSVQAGYISGQNLKLDGGSSPCLL